MSSFIPREVLPFLAVASNPKFHVDRTSQLSVTLAPAIIQRPGWGKKKKSSADWKEAWG